MCHVWLATIASIKRHTLLRREIEMRAVPNPSVSGPWYAMHICIMWSREWYSLYSQSWCVRCWVAWSCNLCHLVPTNNLLPILDFRCENCECMQNECGEPFNMVHRLVRMRIEISAHNKDHYVYLFTFRFKFFSICSHFFSGPPSPLISDSYACGPFLHMIPHKPAPRTNDSVAGLFEYANWECFRVNGAGASYLHIFCVFTTRIQWFCMMLFEILARWRCAVHLHSTGQRQRKWIGNGSILWIIVIFIYFFCFHSFFQFGSTQKWYLCALGAVVVSSIATQFLPHTNRFSIDRMLRMWYANLYRSSQNMYNMSRNTVPVLHTYSAMSDTTMRYRVSYIL